MKKEIRENNEARRLLTDEEAEQVTGGQNSEAMGVQTIQPVYRRSEIGFSFKEVDDPGSVNEEEN